MNFTRAANVLITVGYTGGSLTVIFVLFWMTQALIVLPARIGLHTIGQTMDPFDLAYAWDSGFAKDGIFYEWEYSIDESTRGRFVNDRCNRVLLPVRRFPGHRSRFYCLIHSEAHAENGWEIITAVYISETDQTVRLTTSRMRR
jgi:hypothetical protein